MNGCMKRSKTIFITTALALGLGAAFFPNAAEARRIENGGFSFWTGKEWKRRLPDIPDPDRRHPMEKMRGLIVMDSLGGEAWIFHVLIKEGKRARLEEGLKYLVDPHSPLSAHLTAVRLLKLKFCDIKKKEKKKRRRRGRRKKYCKHPSYRGQGRALYSGSRKVRFYFNTMEKKGRTFLLVVAGTKGFAKNKKSKKRLKKISGSLK